MNRTDASERRAELWVRASAPAGTGDRYASAVDRLRSLAEDDVFDDVTIHMWGPQLSRGCAMDTEEGQRIVDRVEHFESWATDRGYSLEPFFETHTVECEFTDSRDTVLTLPAVALAEFDDAVVTHVVPHSRGETSWTVEDRLHELEGATEPTPDRPAVSVAPE